MAWDDEFDPTEDDGFVPAAYARSMEEAEELRQLLEDHGIEAVLGDESEAPERSEDSDTTLGAITHGVPILVPEMYLDEAGEIIADREDTDEFEIDDEEDEDDEDEFAIGDEEEDGFFQIEEEDDELYGEEDEEGDYLDEEEEQEDEEDDEDAEEN
ncbi:MAG: hypothetical protein JXA11_16580 [Phycisphaerae bacterium]|nr:hypothetical protein [Phycisphaerae bacterium]